MYEQLAAIFPTVGDIMKTHDQLQVTNRIFNHSLRMSIDVHSRHCRYQEERDDPRDDTTP